MVSILPMSLDAVEDTRKDQEHIEEQMVAGEQVRDKMMAVS